MLVCKPFGYIAMHLSTVTDRRLHRPSAYCVHIFLDNVHRGTVHLHVFIARTDTRRSVSAFNAEEEESHQPAMSLTFIVATLCALYTCLCSMMMNETTLNGMTAADCN